MTPLVLYLNEKSSKFGLMSPEKIAGIVIDSIKAVREARSLRNELSISSSIPLAEITFGVKQHTLGSILTGENHEYWGYLKGVVLRCPFDVTPTAKLPDSLEEVSYREEPAEAMLWAWKNDSFTLSFGHRKPWNSHTIKAIHRVITSNAGIGSRDISVKNIAKISHVSKWKTEIKNSGKEISSSSLIYIGPHFVFRMHFDDHGFPHVHVHESKKSTKVRLKIRVDNCDTLDGEVEAGFLKDVIDVIERNQGQLLENWERRGRHEKMIVIQG